MHRNSPLFVMINPVKKVVRDPFTPDFPGFVCFILFHDYYLENSLVSSMFAANQLFSWFVGVLEHYFFINVQVFNPLCNFDYESPKLMN